LALRDQASSAGGDDTLFVVFAVPGPLDDGGIGPSDIIAIGSDTLTFSP
jgi:hypothetical protein